MAYTTTQLITNAYYSSGVVSREFETVSGGQISDGLAWLNDIISETDINSSMVPTETTFNQNFIIGQEKYFIPNLSGVDTLTFFLDSVRYAMKFTKRNEYFGASRVENIQSLPFEWYVERTLGGSNIYVYFKPDRAYPMEIHGIFKLTNVSLGQDLNLTFDQYYITYMRYALSDRICSEYNYETPPNVMRQLDKYTAWIDKTSRVLDLSISKVSTLQKRGTFNWAFINLSKGWQKPG